MFQVVILIALTICLRLRFYASLGVYYLYQIDMGLSKTPMVIP